MACLGDKDGSLSPDTKISELSLAYKTHETKQQQVLESFKTYLQGSPKAINMRVQVMLTDMIDPCNPEQKSCIDAFKENITSLTPKLTLRMARWYHYQEDYSSAIATLRIGLGNVAGAEDKELMSLEQVNELMNLQFTLEYLRNEITDD